MCKLSGVLTKHSIFTIIQYTGEFGMWWNKVIFGTDSYYVVWWFLTYSILGWAVESLYMSFCNRKLTNRGFARGPFCPIYGVGALTVYFLLRRYEGNTLTLFVCGSFLATALEFVTALLMLRVFGEFWWDYKEKPFNYKGILCVESSIAWGFYTVFLFGFLQKMVASFVQGIPIPFGKVAGSVLLFVFAADFLHSFYEEKKEALPKWTRFVTDRIRR